MKKIIKDRIKELREEGYTDEQIANELDISNTNQLSEVK